MNLRKLVIPLIAVLAIVALGAVATATLVVASPQQSPSSQGGPTPVPPPDIVLEIPPKTSAPPAPKQSTCRYNTQENTEPKPAPKTTLDRGPKGSRIPPGPAVELSSQSTSGTEDGGTSKTCHSSHSCKGSTSGPSRPTTGHTHGSGCTQEN